MLSGLLLPQAWDTHFLSALQDPQFMAEWWVFLYMDIKMHQQLVQPICSRDWLPSVPRWL